MSLGANALDKPMEDPQSSSDMEENDELWEVCIPPEQPAAADEGRTETKRVADPNCRDCDHIVGDTVDLAPLILRLTGKTRKRKKRLKHTEVPGDAVSVPAEFLAPELVGRKKKKAPESSDKEAETSDVDGNKKKKTKTEGETPAGEGSVSRQRRRRFTPLIAPGIPIVTSLEQINLPQLEKKGISLLNFAWEKQMQILRRYRDAENSIKLFKYNVSQGLMPDAAIVATLFSTINSVADVLEPGVARSLADFVRRVNPPVSENSLFCMLRLYCLEKNQESFDIAMQILQEIKVKFYALLRDYSPLFTCLRELKTPVHLDKAFDLLEEVKQSKYDILECHFLDVLVLATELRTEQTDRIYNMLLYFKEVIYRPSKLMLDALENWFIFQSENTDCHRPSRGVVGQYGVCNCCYRQLKSIDLTEAEFDLMLDQINTLLKDAGKNASGKLRPRPVFSTAAERISPFQIFQNWLRVNGPFDVVIDGANVGYHQWRPRDNDDILNFQQIHSIYEYWRREGKRVLVVLHERHVDHSRMARMSKYNFQGIVQRWTASQSLYLTPKGSNDDWYWLYAGLVGTRHNRRMFLVTNDQMRDHHFATLSTRHFVKWRGRHMVTYTFENRQPVFRPPAVVSYQSQLDCNEMFTFWHFPLSPPMIAQTRTSRVAPEPYTTAATASVALTSTLSEDLEDLEAVEWLCAQNLTTVFAPVDDVPPTR